MGNRCSGCCPWSPSESHPQSQSPPPQCPSEPHPQSQSAPPQSSSGSQAQGVDYERRFGDIKDATELKPLIDHVEQLLSGIEQAQSAHPVKTESNKVSAFVKGMIEPASQFLEKISTTGDELKKNNFAANLSGEMKTVISAAMENMGKLHWLALGFSVIAFVLDRIDQVSSNFNECVRLLRKMVDLAKRLQVLHTRMPHEIEKLNEAVRAIVEGAITCCCCMSQTKLFRYLLASTNEANLDNIGKATEELERLLILMIAMDIQEQIPRYYLAEPEIPSDTVGIDDRIEKVIQLLDMESKGPARAVLLHGFGGVGKTTLAKCVMSKLDLRGIKHSSIQLGDKQLNENQQDLCFELKGEILMFKDCEAGRAKLKEILGERPTFIFIDNVLRKDQITELLPSQLSLPSGSRLLLTSRNVNVIEELRCRNIACKEYPVDELPEEAAKEYFRKAIIRSEQIIAALERRDISLDNVDAVATACRGVPLLLRVYAQYLARCGTDRRVYDEMLGRLQQGEFHSDSEDHLSERLLYVYHKLSQDDQDAFVDICTYFHSWEEDDVSYIVSKTTLRDLIDGALVKIDESNKVIVHDVLKSLGIKEGKKTRIQSVQDLDNAEEVNNIKGIWLPSSSCNLSSEILFAAKNRLRVLALGRNVRLTSQCDLPFSKLRFLHIENLHDLPTFYSKLPENLSYLRIETREFRLSERIWMNLKSLGHLQKFVFECWEITMFPNDCQLPASLIELDFSNCHALQQLPTELCSLTGLSKLKLDGCKSLKSLPKKFYNLSELTYLSMEDCFDLQTLPEKFGQLSSLERLNLSGCSHLETLGEDFGGLSSLQSLNIHRLDKLMALPERFADLRKLRKLTIQVCRSLRSLPDGFGELGTLQSLDLRGCAGLTCLPDRLGDLGTLQSLYLRGCAGLTCLPDRLGDLGTLQSLDLSGCAGLTCLPDTFGQLLNLQYLTLDGCSELTNLPNGFGNLKSLNRLSLSGCKNLSIPPEKLEN